MKVNTSTYLIVCAIIVIAAIIAIIINRQLVREITTIDGLLLVVFSLLVKGGAVVRWLRRKKLLH